MKLKMIEERDRKLFKEKVEKFLNGPIVLKRIKFQRNVYYSLSGSGKTGRDSKSKKKHLLESYLAFIVYIPERELF